MNSTTRDYFTFEYWIWLFCLYFAPLSNSKSTSTNTEKIIKKQSSKIELKQPRPLKHVSFIVHEPTLEMVQQIRQLPSQPFTLSFYDQQGFFKSKNLEYFSIDSSDFMNFILSPPSDINEPDVLVVIGKYLTLKEYPPVWLKFSEIILVNDMKIEDALSLAKQKHDQTIQNYGK